MKDADNNNNNSNNNNNNNNNNNIALVRAKSEAPINRFIIQIKHISAHSCDFWGKG